MFVSDSPSISQLEALALGPASVRWTDARHGSFGAALTGSDEWLRVNQVHGNGVVFADQFTPPLLDADALVTAERNVPLAIATADCAPIALASAEGIIGAVHAGWRGLHAGVVGNAIAAMRELGAIEISAALGPCIHVECYEFEDALHLADFAARWGSAAVGETKVGSPAFDLPAAVQSELAHHDVELVFTDDRCTSCSPELFSYRTTQTPERQIMVVERPSDEPSGKLSIAIRC